MITSLAVVALVVSLVPFTSKPIASAYPAALLSFASLMATPVASFSTAVVTVVLSLSLIGLTTDGLIAK